MNKEDLSLGLGIVGLVVEFISVIILGWLAIIGCALGIIGLVVKSDSMGKKIPSIAAIPIGFILTLIWIITLTSLR